MSHAGPVIRIGMPTQLNQLPHLLWPRERQVWPVKHKPVRLVDVQSKLIHRQEREQQASTISARYTMQQIQQSRLLDVSLGVNWCKQSSAGHKRLGCVDESLPEVITLQWTGLQTDVSKRVQSA